jgi:hypothetical protein
MVQVKNAEIREAILDAAVGRLPAGPSRRDRPTLA